MDVKAAATPAHRGLLDTLRDATVDCAVMKLSPLRAWGAAALLCSALALAHAESGLAHLGILWRTTLLSWDSPATQLLDEVASQTAPASDPSRQAADSVTGACAGERLQLLDRSHAPADPGFHRQLSRSPPTA